jgi:hypothetical protein
VSIVIAANLFPCSQAEFRCSVLERMLQRAEQHMADDRLLQQLQDDVDEQQRKLAKLKEDQPVLVSREEQA